MGMVYGAIAGDTAFQKDFRLRGQIAGAAVSVMANIVEGFVRRSNREFLQFLFIATSSAAELQSHLYVALDQKYISTKTFDEIYAQADKTARIISGLITYLRKNIEQHPLPRPARPPHPPRPPKPTQPPKQTQQTKSTRETKGTKGTP